MKNEFKALSRINWNGEDTSENIQTGCLQRIADATELMATNYRTLQNERDMYKRWYEEKQKYCNGLDNRIRSLKGVITRMKNKSH